MARTKKAARRVLRGAADSGSHGLSPLAPYPPPPVPSPTHAIPAANDSQQAAQSVESCPSAEGWNNVLSTALAPLHRRPDVASPPLTSPLSAVDNAPPLTGPVSFSTDAFISPFASLLPQAPQRDLCDRCNAAVMPVASTPTSSGPTSTSACFCICCRRPVPVAGFGVDDRSERRILRRCSACASAAPDALHDMASKLPIQLQHAGAIDRAHASVWKEVMKFEDHIRAQPHVPSLVAADALLLKLADLAVQHKKERHDVLQRAVALLAKGGSSSQQRVSLFNEWLAIEIERVSVWSRKAERCCTLLAGRGIAVSLAAQELMKAARLTVAVPSMPNGAVVCEGCSSVLALPLPSTSPHGDACHCCQRRLPTSAMVQIRSGGRLCTSCHPRCQDHSRVARMAHGRLDLEQLEPITEFVRSLLARVREAMSGDTQQLDELCAPHLNVWDALERRGKVLSRNQQRKFASGHTPVVSSRQLYADFEDMARNWQKTLREIVHIAATRELRFAIQLTPDEHKLLDELFTNAVRPVFHNAVTTTALAPPIKAPASGSKGVTLKDKSAARNLLATPSSTGIPCEGCKALLYVVPQLSEATQDHQRFVVSCHCCCRRLPMAVMVRHESGSVMCTSCVTGSNGSATFHLGFDHLNAIISRVQKLVAAARGLSDTDVEPFKRECAVQLSKLTPLSARWKNIRKRHRRDFLQGEKTVDMCRQMYTEASNCEQAAINAVRVLARLAADRADVMTGLAPLNKRARSQLVELFRGVDMPLSVSKLIEGVESASKQSPKKTAPPPPPKLPASSVRKQIVPELISSTTTPVPPSLDPKDCCGQCAAVLETTGHPSGSSFGFCDCCERVLPSDVTAKVDVERDVWACAACRSRHHKLPDCLSTLRSPQRVTFERMETVHRVSTSLRTVIQESYQDAMWSKDQVDHVVTLMREADKWVQRRSDLEREHLQQIQKGKTPLWTSKKMYDDAVIVGSAYEQAHVTLIKALAAACRERRIRVPVNLTDILSASKRSEATVPEAVVVATPRSGDSRAAKTTATTTVVSDRQQVQASRPHQDSMSRKLHTAKSAVSTSIPTAKLHDQQAPSHHTAATPHRNCTQLGPPITTNQQHPPIHSVGGTSQPKHTQRGPLGAPKHAMVPEKLPSQRVPTHHAAETLNSNHPQGGPPVVAPKVNQPHPPIHYADGASQKNHTQRGSLGTPKLATAPIKNHTIVPTKSARPTSSSTNHSAGRYVSVTSSTVEPIVKPTKPLTSQQGSHDSPQQSHAISTEKAPETPRGESQQHRSGNKHRRSRSSDVQEKADSEPHSKSRSRARSSTRSTRRSRSRSRSSSRRRRQSRSRSRSRSKSRKTRSRDRYRTRRRSRSSSRSSSSSSSRSPSRSRSRDKLRLRDSRKRRRSRSRDRSRSKRRSRSRSLSRSSSRSRSRSRSRRDDQRNSSRTKSSKRHSPSSRADRRRCSRSCSRSRSRDRRS